jgi:Rieske 2Fe-2S family protein
VTLISWKPRELPTQGARTLPGAYFTSPEIFREEGERIFTRRWLCLDREERIGRPGDYFVTEVAGESIIILRDQQATPRAFFNLCRHRGARLCEEPCGRFSETLQCPYHAWTYSLDGRLIGAPNMNEVEDFSKADWPLNPVGLAVWEGFLFLNLEPRPEPFERAFEPLIGRFSRFNLPRLRLGRTVSYEVKANWKLIVQNYSECYHCPLVHPALNKITPPALGENDLSEGPFIGGYMIMTGGESMTLTGRSCGRPVGDLPPEDHQRVYYYSIMPNMLLSLHPDYVMFHTLWPLAPDLTRIHCSWLFHPDTLGNPQYNINDGVEFWDMTNRQDWHVCELSQLGVSSRAYQPGPYSRRESCPIAFDRDYLEAMGKTAG